MSILSRLVLTKSIWNDIISEAIQVFSQRGFDAQRKPLRRWGGGGGGGMGASSRKILKFQVLGNAISAILRQRQHVLISHFLK